MKRTLVLVSVLLAVSLVCFAAPQRTLRLEIFDRGNTPAGALENGLPAQWIQKAFGDPNNVKVEWVLVPRPKEVEKLNLMMAAGDAPDLSFTYDAVLVGSYAQQGGLADLTALLNKSGTTLKKFLGQEVLDYGTFDGKVYAIPGKRSLLGISGTWIRKDWLDKLGLPVPKTTQQFLTAVRAFRDKDPGKVGANLAPIGGGGADVNIMYSFYKPSTERDRAAWIGPSSTRPARDLAIPGTKEGLKFINMIQNEGLFQKDWALWPKNDVVNFQAALSNGYMGAFTNNKAYIWFYNILPAIQKNSPDAYWVPIDPFTNSEGKTPKYIYNPIGIFNIVPSFSKNADLVVKYLDWMADLKNLTQIIYGTKGVQYDINPEGIVIPRKVTGDLVWEYNILDRAMILNGRPYDTMEKVARAEVLSYVDDKYKMDLFLEHYKQLEKDGIPPVRIATPPDSLSKMAVMLLDKAEELQKQLIMAKPSEFDAMYDADLKEWMDMGARQVKEDMLKAYDAEHKK
jgi:putative aldouronate transport system substrate-binding protein